MKAQLKVETSASKIKSWVFPINVSLYNCSPYLTNSEKEEIKFVLERKKTWMAKSYENLERLLRPLNDALDIAGCTSNTHRKVRKVILCEINDRQTSFWAWTKEDWYEILRPTHKDFREYYKVYDDCRPKLTLVIYLLFNINAYRIHDKFSPSLFANRLFGEKIVDQVINTVYEEYLKLGYGEARVKNRFSSVICDALIANRSPYLENLTVEFLDILRRDDHFPQYVKSDLVCLANTLASLGIITKPLKRLEVGKSKTSKAITGVPLEWHEWCQRWHDTSTLALKTRKQTYYKLLKVGRWIAQEHPSVVTPEQWNRDLGIKFVAAVDRMLVGQYIISRTGLTEKINKPLSPRDKEGLLSSLRRFFRDCQEWEWIPRSFSPERTLATPRSIRALIGPNPRVIADDVWAKLLWAGLNLIEKDLPQPNIGNTFCYPLEMVQSIVIMWLFAGLRSDEIYRIRVGCVRWQKNDVIVPGTNEVVPKDTICYLDIPINKTGTAHTKPVDRLVGEAVESWEKIRPDQSPTVDHKDGSIVHYLFFYRGRKVGKGYLNTTIIPMLCRKAGVPTNDVRGNITSHRARSTIASQLANAKEPMTLFELKEWLGHSNVASTVNYTKISPTKLAKSYQDADYFKRNTRTVEVLIDQDAVKTGAAAAGGPWMFYDLGHGYCTYDFFDQCKHRMACAKCNFYVSKDSSKGQILESKANLQQMLQEIPLTEDERAAVEDGIEAMEKLSAKLAEVPTPSGQTPQEIGN